MKHRLNTFVYTALLMTGLFTSRAQGLVIDCDCEDFTGSFDSTITFGIGWRASDPDKANFGVGNGGNYPTLNEDDGNLNYAQWDVYQALLKSNHELDFRLCNWGVFARLQFLYDFDVIHGVTKRLPHTRPAKSILGEDVILLDLYFSYDTTILDCCIPLSIRFGQQVLNWGESTFIPNGLNSIAPVDVSKLRTAGSELRDALLPVPMIRFDLALSNTFSVGGWWQFWWRETRIDPKGTFFSTNDFISPGARYAMIAPGGVGDDSDFCINPFTCSNPALFGQSAVRGPDEPGHNTGSAGIFFHYFAENFNETEFGLYFATYSSRLPIASAYRGDPVLALPAAARYIPNSYYFVQYPDHIKVMGFSFNTTVGEWAVAGEYSYHLDQPLQIDDAQILAAALAGVSQLGTFGDDTLIRGYRRKEYSQAQITLTRFFGTKFGFNETILVAEAGFTRIHNLESRKVIHYEAPGTAWNIGYGDKFAAGYRILLRNDYNNFFCSWNLIPRVAFAHDLFGTLPAPITHFVKDRMQVTAAVEATYLNKYSLEFAYTNFFGGGVHNLLRDRDFLTFSMSYSF